MKNLFPYQRPEDLSTPFDFDSHMSAIDFYKVTNTKPSDYPTKWIEPAPWIINDFKAILKKDKLNVGLCWAGNPSHANDKLRSFPLKTFLPFNELDHVNSWSLTPSSRLSKGAESIKGVKNIG